MKRGDAAKIALGAALGLLLTAGTASAAITYGDDFGRDNPDRQMRGGSLEETAHGIGWKSGQPYRPLPDAWEFSGSDLVSYETGGEVLPDSRGMLELLLVNDSRGDKVDGADTVFEFFSFSQQKALMAVRVDWDHPGGTMLSLAGDEYHPSMFTQRLLLPKVARGDLLHLAISWDDLGAKRMVIANGKEAAVAPPLENVSTNVRAAQMRPMRTQPIGDLFASADGVRIGAFGSEDYFWPDGEQPANETVILKFALHDDPEGPMVLAPGEERSLAAAVSDLFHDATAVAGFSNALVAGDTMTVTLQGAPGAAPVFDVARLPDVLGRLAVGWAGFGVYLDEDKRFFDDDEIDLSEVEEYRVYVSETPIGDVTVETIYEESLEPGEQGVVIDGLTPEVPVYVTVMALMEDESVIPVVAPLQSLPMTEVEGSAGVYEGILTVEYGDLYPEAVIVGRMGEGADSVFMVDDEEFEINASLEIAMEASVTEMEADEESTSEITVTVTDANGEAVSGHEVKFVLATTSQYTGVVGGGTFFDEVGGTLDRDFTAETDLFGQATVTYTAGFAAKTAIIVARDMESNDTGAVYVKTYITAAAELELEAVQEVAGKALGYKLTLTSSDEWLTADGESEARITALVTKDGIPVEGHRIGFTVTAGTGSIRTVEAVTGDDGKARAVYTAGKKIGIVLIRATDHTVRMTSTIQIELRSDAPAKIAITIDPEVLPADGSSTAEVAVVVTDINDNPNEGVEVEYAVSIGTGRLRDIEELTDDDGASSAQYVAGRLPGKVSIAVTVRSTVPTEEEMAAARALATAVPDYDFF